MKLQRVALFFGLFALLVNGPRFVLTFLRVESELLQSGLLPAGVERLLLIATGVGTAIVLTGGGMLIAHVLARPSTPRGMVRGFLALCWVLLLGFTVVILAPGFVAAIRTSDFAPVLTSNLSQWSWSIVAVLAVEVLAAGAIAGATLAEDSEQKAEQPGGPSAVDQLAGAGLQRVLSWLEPQERGDGARPETTSIEEVRPVAAVREEPATYTVGPSATGNRRAKPVEELVPCKYADLGCDWMGRKAQKGGHVRGCPFNPSNREEA